MNQPVAQRARRPTRPPYMGYLSEDSPRSSGAGALAGVCATGWNMHRSHSGERAHCAADRVLIDRRGAGTASIVHAARAHRPLMVKLIAGHGAGGGRRGPRPERPGAVGVRGLHPGQVPAPGASPRTAGDVSPRSSGGPAPVSQAARPREGHGRVGRLRFSPPARGRTWLPGAPALGPGVTLSDAGGHGKRAHSRRYGGNLIGACQSGERFCNGRSARAPIRAQVGSVLLR